MALECGFDAGFSVGTKPSDVASYIVDEFLRRQSRKKDQPKTQIVKKNKTGETA